MGILIVKRRLGLGCNLLKARLLTQCLVAFISVTFAFSAGGRAFASPSDVDGQPAVAALTHKILALEIELERYYSNYRLIGSTDPKWRHFRYFWLQEGASGLNVAQNVLSLNQFAQHMKRPDLLNTQVLRRAVKVAMVSSILEGGSSAFELSVNAATAIKHKRSGTDPKSVLLNVKDRLSKIDALMKERADLVEQTKESSSYQLHLTEGRVLSAFRDWCVFECADVWADAHTYQASSSVYFASDVIASSLYYASFLVDLRGFQKIQLFGPASIVGSTGDCFGIISAPAAAVTYKILKQHWRKEFGKRLGEDVYNAEARAKFEMHNLEDILLDSGVETLADAGAVLPRLEVYRIWSSRYDEFMEKRTIDERRLDQVALQSTIAGPSISTTYLAQDIMGIISSYGLKRNPVSANILDFASFIPTTVGAGGAVLVSSNWYFGDYLHHRKLKKRNALPTTLLKKRLETLDELEALLNGASPQAK